ncbi:TPA: amidase, partial [Enterococcus faecium]|nr:amidase [Enterococcus faecium]
MVQFTGIAMSVITINPQVLHADGIATYDAQFNCTTEGSGSGTDSDGNDTGSGAVTGDVAKNIEDIYKYMNGEYGLSGASIAGILGNWKQESGIDPRTVEGYYGDGQREVDFIKQFTDGLMGIGYGQWTAGRHTALVDWSKKNNGGSWWTTEAQLDFMFKGDGGFVGILKDYALNASDDVVENAVTFHKNWEISADSESAVIAVRGENAKEIWKYMKSKGMDGAKDESKINKIS